MHALSRYLARRRREMVLAHVSGRLLDVGCGTNKLVKAYGNGVGVDVYAWDGADLVVQDTASLPFPDHAFDTVSFLACLNHIPNRQQVLREVHRCLKPDGTLLVTMIGSTISFVWHTLNRRWDDDQAERGMAPGEVYGINRHEMIGLLDAADFDVVQTRRFILRLNTLYVACNRPDSPNGLSY